MNSRRIMYCLIIMVIFFLMGQFVSRMPPINILLAFPAGYLMRYLLSFKYHLFAAGGILLGVFFSPANSYLIMFGDYLHRPAIFIVLSVPLLWLLGGFTKVAVSSITSHQRKTKAGSLPK